MDCDRISELPDSLLAHVLSYLPIYFTVKTSVLSKRWKFLWLKVTRLELHTDVPPHEEALSQVMGRFLEFNQGLSFQKLKVDYYYDYRKVSHIPERLKEWIATLTDRGIQDLQFRHPSLVEMPMNVFKSKTLVSLELVNVGFETQEFVLSLPCLKIMKLESIDYGNLGPLFIEKLISSCPLLEDLTLAQENLHKYIWFLSVRSQTLKIFHFISGWSLHERELSVEMDAPGLKFMKFTGRQADRIVIKNMSCSVKIDLDTVFNEKFGFLEAEDLRNRNNIEEFLTGISSVRHMIISMDTVKGLYHYSRQIQIPKFHNLSHLEASCPSLLLQFLLDFLDNCPNLKNLKLGVRFLLRVNLTNGNVPRCLTSTLEYVRIKSLDLDKEAGIQLVKYFLENSAILKKLILDFGHYHPTMSNNYLGIIMKFFTSTKLSSKCQVSVA